MPVIDQAVRFRNELQRHETQATNQAIDAYQLLTNRLEDKLTVLQAKFEALESKGQLTPENVRKLAVWSSLLQQLENEVDKFGGFVDTNNRIAATKSIEMASKHAEKLTAINFETKPDLTKAFKATWDRLPTESIETLLGFLQNDSELRRGLTNSLGVSASQNFQNKLLEGIALGYNPKKINSLINQALGEPLTWSINTIRTTQMYSYREATRANYIANSEIVGGWKWYAALDGRTCLSCVNQHGKEFPVSATLNDHHQGRCTQIPLIDKPERFGLQSPQIETGETWFNNLPKKQQIQMMGQERHRAYQQGKFKFQELSETYDNDSFGKMLKEASLKSLLGNKQTKTSISTKSIQTTKAISNNLHSSLKDLITIQEDLGELQSKVIKAIDLIDKVHTLPKDRSKLEVERINNVALDGSYNVANRIIRLQKNASDIPETFIHEFGHYLEYHGFNKDDQPKAYYDKAFENWLNEVNNSASVKLLKDKLNNPDKYTKKSIVGDITLDTEYLEYLLKPNELFARSYTQYIYTKNNQADKYKGNTLEFYGGDQWEANDFKEIEKAFDKFFKELGWNK